MFKEASQSRYRVRVNIIRLHCSNFQGTKRITSNVVKIMSLKLTKCQKDILNVSLEGGRTILWYSVFANFVGG